MRYSPWLMDGGENPLAPNHVIEELQEIDRRLGLQYHVGLNAFVVTLRWPEDDPRREFIKRGEMNPETDFEILCPVPHDVSLDELRSWLAGQLRRVSHNRSDIKQMVEAEEQRLAKQNAAIAEHAGAEARAVLQDAIGSKNINVGRRRTKVQ